MEISYKDFDKFLDYLEPKVDHDGSVGLVEAIKEHWGYPEDDPIQEQIIAKLNRTGKYVVQKGEISNKLWIRFNPNHDVNESIKGVNKIQGRILILSFALGVLSLVTTIINICITQKNLKRQIDIQSRQSHLIPPPIHIDSIVVHLSRTNEKK